MAYGYRISKKSIRVPYIQMQAEDEEQKSRTAKGESHVTHPTTLIVEGSDQIIDIVAKTLSKTNRRLCVCGDRGLPMILVDNPINRGMYVELNRRGVQIQIVSEITEENMVHCKKLIEDFGVELRHLNKVLGSFAVSDEKEQYLGSAAIPGSSANERVRVQLVWSTVPALVEQNQFVFDSFWSMARPASVRFREIEKGGSDKSPRETKMIHDPLEIIDCIKKMCETSSGSLLFCTDTENMVQGYRLLLDSYKTALANHRLVNKPEDSSRKLDPPSSRFRWLVPIAGENPEKTRGVVEVAKALLDLGVELRHIDSTPLLKFAIKDSSELYVTFEAADGREVVANVLFSNEDAYVKQFEAAFDEAWHKSVSAGKRIIEIESGKELPKTVLLTEPDEIEEEVSKALRESTKLHTFTNSDGLRVSLTTHEEEYRRIIAQKNGSIRLLIPIETERDIVYVKKGLQLGLEIRHINQKPQPQFSLTDTKLFTTMDRMVGSDFVSHLLMTNEPLYMQQYEEIFQKRWESEGLDARERVREIEEGIEPDRTEIVSNLARAAEIARECFQKCEREILIIMASQQVITRNLLLYQEMIESTRKRNVRVRILLPSVSSEAAKLFQNVEYRTIDRMNVGYAIYDRKKMFITQYALPSDGSSSPNSAPSIFHANIFTTNREHIAGVVSIFDALWRESDLRQAAERSRREAELLQDILSHDIRNYNQAARLNAELLEEDLPDGNSKNMINSLIRSIDGSTALVERAAKIGKILAAGDRVKLYPINLAATLEESLATVRKARADNKHITLKLEGSDHLGDVLADDMLSEVFVNLLSNSAKYTESKDVTIKVVVDSKGDYRRITIEDYGRGIPEEQKNGLFTRYLKNAHGSGLGLSIVHALVVERYRGKIAIRDRVEGDYTQGTVIEILLPKA